MKRGSGRPSDGAGSNAAYESKKYGILLSYASIIVTILTGLLYTPVMLRLLGQNEYGIYQLANSLVTYLSLLNLGLNGSYIKFYMREKVKGDKEGVAGVNGMFLLLFRQSQYSLLSEERFWYAMCDWLETAIRKRKLS